MLCHARITFRHHLPSPLSSALIRLPHDLLFVNAVHVLFVSIEGSSFSSMPVIKIFTEHSRINLFLALLNAKGYLTSTE